MARAIADTVPNGADKLLPTIITYWLITTVESPRFNGARSNDIRVLIDYVNNVNYNWGGENSCYGGDMVEGRSHYVNMI